MDPIKAKPPVCYVLVRADLPIELQMVHACHAAQEVVQVAPVDDRTVIRLLHVKDVDELMVFHWKLYAKDFRWKLICEPDPPWCGEAMALATEPSVERISALGKIFFHLPRAQFGTPGAGDVG